jgi:hypothetical protein
MARPTGPPPAMNTDVWRVASAAMPMRVSPCFVVGRESAPIFVSHKNMFNMVAISV